MGFAVVVAGPATDIDHKYLEALNRKSEGQAGDLEQLISRAGYAKTHPQTASLAVVVRPFAEALVFNPR